MVKNQQIYFVTGKGGVGKSSVAMGLSYHLAQEGKKTLFVELNPQSQMGPLLIKTIEFEPINMSPNLWASCWDGDSCMKDYVRHFLKIEQVVEVFFNNAVMKTFLKAAPSLKEISILGKATSSIRQVGPQMDYEAIVIDCFATGHFNSLIMAPKGLSEAVKFGPMGEQSKQIFKVLQDSSTCKYLIVTLADELSISECIEQCDFVKNYLNIQPQIILNKVWRVPNQVKLYIESNNFNINKISNSDTLTSLDLISLAHKRYQRGISRISSDYNFLNLFWEMGMQGEELFKLLACELKKYEW